MYSTLQSVQYDPCGIWHLSALRTKEGNDPSFCRWSFKILSSLSAERAGRLGVYVRGFLRAAETRNAMTHIYHL